MQEVTLMFTFFLSFWLRWMWKSWTATGFPICLFVCILSLRLIALWCSDWRIYWPIRSAAWASNRWYFHSVQMPCILHRWNKAKSIFHLILTHQLSLTSWHIVNIQQPKWKIVLFADLRCFFSFVDVVISQNLHTFLCFFLFTAICFCIFEWLRKLHVFHGEL